MDARELGQKVGAALFRIGGSTLIVIGATLIAGMSFGFIAAGVCLLYLNLTAKK